MCAVTSIVDRSVRSIESIDGRYGGCGRRSSPKPPSHKPRRRLNSSSTPGLVDCARARCGGKRYPGCLSVPLPPKSPDPPPPPPTIPSKPPRSSSPGTTMLGQSPLTRARCGGGGARSLDHARGVWRLRWRWRAVTSPVTRVTRAARHARVRVRRHRASRASSPFPSPPCTTGTRALLRRRRSLARARGGGAVGFGGGVQLHRASRASRSRACTSSPRIARVITVPLPPRAHTRALRRRRRSLAR